MDVLNLLRSKASWGFRSGNCEMQELQELQGKTKPKQTMMSEDSSLSDASTLVSNGAGVESEREPLAACVPNHPRFGARSVQSVDDASLMSADVESLSNCSSGQRGPRAAPSELGTKERKEQEENAFRDPSQHGGSDRLSDDASESDSEEDEPLSDPVFEGSFSGLSSLRIATNLLPKEMHMPTPASAHDVTEEAPLTAIKAEPSYGGDVDEEREATDTSFSPPPSQAIERNAAFSTPAAYPRILSKESTGTPTCVVQEERAEEAQGDGVARTIKAAQSENDHQAVRRGTVVFGRAAGPGSMGPGLEGVESSPQAALRRERLRKQKEAAEKVQQEMHEMQALMEALLAQVRDPSYSFCLMLIPQGTEQTSFTCS